MVYDEDMAKDVIRISEAEAATTNVEELLVHVRAGRGSHHRKWRAARDCASLGGITSRPSPLGICRAGGSPRLDRYARRGLRA